MEAGGGRSKSLNLEEGGAVGCNGGVVPEEQAELPDGEWWRSRVEWLLVAEWSSAMSGGDK